MTLTIHTEQDEQRQLLLKIEVAEERVEKQMRETARKLSREYNVPGFRRGKAPYTVIAKRIGHEALRGEAVEELIQPIFEEAMKQIDPDIYAPAQFDDLELEPLVLKFTIPLTPEVDLGDYRALRKEIEPVNVTDEAVAAALERIRNRHQILEEVARPAAAGDMVTISGRGELILEEDIEEDEAEEDSVAAATGDLETDTAINETVEVDDPAVDHVEGDGSDDDDFDDDDDVGDDDILFDTERMELVLDSSQVFPGTPFVENVIGMSVGDSKDFTFTFPDDYEDDELVGLEAMFSVTVLQVQSRELPELDEELAQKEGHETLAELQQETRKTLEEAAHSQAKTELMDGMIEDMLKIATMVYPPAAVEEEISRRLESFKNQIKRSGWEWDDYLKLQTTNEEALRTELREAAAETVQQQLTLRQFVLNEKLKIEEAEVNAKVEERIAAFSDNETLANSMRDYYNRGAGLEMISGDILMEKVVGRMRDILTGVAPSLEELSALEEMEEDGHGEATPTNEATETAVLAPEVEEPAAQTAVAENDKTDEVAEE